MRTPTVTLGGTGVYVPTAVLPGRTPDSGPYWAAADPNGGYACTLPSGHATYAPHIAGTGTVVAAIWLDTHPPRQQPSA